MVMGFKIPLIDQTIFDILLGLALGGPAEAIGRKETRPRKRIL